MADAAQALTEAADIAAVLDDPAVQRAQRIPHRLHTFALHRIARRRQHPVGADPGPAAQRRRRGLQAAGVQRDTRPVRRHRRIGGKQLTAVDGITTANTNFTWF